MMGAPERTPRAKKAAAKPAAKPKVTLARFRVTDDSVAQVSHLSDVYMVKRGKVDLPPNEDWYADLIDAGVLVAE